MREMKFRAWYGDMEMHYDIVPIKRCLIDSKYHYYLKLEKGTNKLNETSIYRGIVTEYTGLKDINKTPIYEGDILADRKYTNVFETVKYKNGQFICIDGMSLYECLNEFELEVVGNIFEKKEL